MVTKKEIIAKYGKDTYEGYLAQSRIRHKMFSAQEAEYRRERFKKCPDKVNGEKRRWKEANREKIKISQRAWNRKGGKHYVKSQLYKQSGLQGARAKIRVRHGSRWRSYKNIIAPNSELHHQWIPGTADYIGLALVEAKTHHYGVIDVINILEGEITLFREGER